MKKTLLLVLAMMFATVSIAQQQLATLNHNDSITVFYGESALSEAHSAAVNGDIITLSPGRFQTSGSLTITKAVTIRGAGMCNDTLGNIRTEINSSMYFDVDTTLNEYLSVEGIYFSSYVEWKKLKSPTFIKCRFLNNLEYYSSSSRMTDARFINCFFDNSFNCYRQKNTQFINSILLNGLTNVSDNTNEGVSIINSIMHYYLTESESQRILIMNSILMGYGGNDYNATTSFYSLGISNSYSYYSSYYYFDTVYTPDHNLHNFQGYSSVFKTFTGDYSEGETFELQDAVANTILGDDGTQVGIYGGSYPFDPNVRNPRIKRCTVAQRATQDNKLAVDIEVVSE